MKELRGKNALLTGGSRGIGLAIGRALAAQGVNLALAARSAHRLELAADELADYGVHTAAIPIDLADELVFASSLIAQKQNWAKLIS